MKTLIVVDFQPEYFVSYKTQVNLKKFLNYLVDNAISPKRKIIYLYNSINNYDPDNNLLGESITLDILKNWLRILFEKIGGIDEERIEKFFDSVKFLAKGYGFIRTHIKDDEEDEDVSEIIRTGFKLYEAGDHNVTRLVNYFKREVEGEAIIVGGYEKQCVAEVVAILKIAEIPYKKNRKFLI